MSNKLLKITATILVLCSFQAGIAYAETNEVDQEAAQMEEIKTKDEMWNQQLKEKYALTDEQIKTLHDSGISYPQLAMVAQLAKSSQKPLEDVLKMRTEQKMGWGKIAKELGVHPREIGQSVRDMKHALREERKIAHADRKEKAEAKKEERRDKHAKKDR
ncbi:hypothetical protein [Bdellovibrio sp. HCB337]|uniref:hypothetical protein n=1 Tax=Bdellovibrio sp. HCB337 TaxID=3394358 RepID=UPI0039A4846F